VHPTRVVKVDVEGEELARRIALFALVSKHPRAEAVLAGLGPERSAVALKLLKTATAWPSPKRQARVTLEFGNRADQHERLAAIFAEAPPALRQAMCAHMSPQQQARFPRLASKGLRPAPGRSAFAARLVREATR
jgi:hypothetical protein